MVKAVHCSSRSGSRDHPWGAQNVTFTDLLKTLKRLNSGVKLRFRGLVAAFQTDETAELEDPVGLWWGQSCDCEITVI